MHPADPHQTAAVSSVAVGITGIGDCATVQSRWDTRAGRSRRWLWRWETVVQE
jgi:hypothetical protein